MRQQRQEQRAARAEAPQGGRWQARQQQAAPQDAGEWQARAAARQQERAVAAQQQQQRATTDGGWRSQRSEGQRYGRNWSNDAAIGREAVPQVPQAPQATERTRRYGDGQWNGQRNRTYSDPNRTRSYGAWQGDRASTYRNGYRDGRTADNYRDRRDQSQAYRQGYDGGYRGGYTSSSRDHRRWDRNDWRRDNRYNWSSYRNQHRDIYRVGRYYSPYNSYRYSRLNIGFFLQPLFYSQNYWIDDPYQYRLPEAYGPYRWVRYYDDALLVDIYSGEVVDVIHDFFW
ncbi:hypothetical protein GKE62_00340 [Novosphingobium sp. Gsoil 351]|nr:hypothetical protein GKE62_00340 [Novosphingobium sp. Gsoil 351]